MTSNYALRTYTSTTTAVTAAEAAITTGGSLVNMVGDSASTLWLSDIRSSAHRSSGYCRVARAGRPAYGSSGDWRCLHERRAADNGGNLLGWSRLWLDCDYLFFDLCHWPVACVGGGSSSSGTDLLRWLGCWTKALSCHYFLCDGYDRCSRGSSALLHDVLIVVMMSVRRHD